MAVIVLASASGAPGVTTTALGLALVWPRPVVLVDADPVGGSAILAGYCRGTVSHNDALVSLMLATRDGRLGSVLPSVLIQLPGTRVSLLPGPRSHGQAASFGDLWPVLSSELQGLQRNGQDVLVDVGRLGMAFSPGPLVSAADVGVLVLRSELTALAATRQWATEWVQAARDGSGALSVCGLVVGEGRPYGSHDVRRTLQLPAVESVAWDPDAAAVLSAGNPVGKKLSSSGLMKSLTGVAAAIEHRLAVARQETVTRRKAVVR